MGQGIHAGKGGYCRRQRNGQRRIHYGHIGRKVWAGNDNFDFVFGIHQNRYPGDLAPGSGGCRNGNQRRCNVLNRFAYPPGIIHDIAFVGRLHPDTLGSIYGAAASHCHKTVTFILPENFGTVVNSRSRGIGFHGIKDCVVDGGGVQYTGHALEQPGVDDPPVGHQQHSLHP